MKTIKVKLYEFSELENEIQKKVIEENRYINVDDDWYKYILKEFENTELKNNGFLDSKIYFSGFYSQGDGACFDCNNFDLKQFCEFNKIDIKNSILSVLCDNLRVYTNKTSFANHYLHEKTRYIDFDFNIYSIKTYKYLNKYIDNIIELIEEKRLSLCKEIYEILERQYSFLINEEAIIETIEANGYTFEANGRMNNG